MFFNNPVAIDPFSAATAFTRAEEGGYSIRADDGGNWTGGIVGAGQLIGSNMGVSAPILVDWLGLDPATAADTMRDLPVEVFETIARGRFWSPLACQALEGAVALMVFDFGWNAGVGRSSRLLQTTVGMTGARVDGQVGGQTLSLVRTPDCRACSMGWIGNSSPSFSKDVGCVRMASPDRLRCARSRTGPLCGQRRWPGGSRRRRCRRIGTCAGSPSLARDGRRGRRGDWPQPWRSAPHTASTWKVASPEQVARFLTPVLGVSASCAG